MCGLGFINDFVFYMVVVYIVFILINRGEIGIRYSGGVKMNGFYI